MCLRSALYTGGFSSDGAWHFQHVSKAASMHSPHVGHAHVAAGSRSSLRRYSSTNVIALSKSASSTTQTEGEGRGFITSVPGVTEYHPYFMFCVAAGMPWNSSKSASRCASAGWRAMYTRFTGR